ncbi:unnamed protein product [Clavelina lepadiformis]|uniref:Spliceosome-associated protein CWC27 homolog n=1 Tax=Clavelina lepadiformis TaxID=159417 RepID=A0ABP0GAA4_CLALP
MSNIYIKEPPTIGKVLLRTSMGDIDVELWSKEAPVACRNFVQLCMEGYYNNVIFHRVVPNFIVQGGDPTGTGEGGESVYGKPFKDEFHSRLRFVRRGLVAMANASPNDNGSQFFFTLASCTDLNKKHTIFGKVTGDTIYNLVRLGEVGTTDDERPINPPFIKWTKVLANPFEDIIPRTVPEKKSKKDEKRKKKSEMKATKDFKLLSFGEEAEEGEEDMRQFDAVHSTTSKSSHDLANDPKLSSTPAIQTSDTDKDLKRKATEIDEENLEDGNGFDGAQRNDMMQRIKDKLQTKPEKKLKTEQDLSTQNKNLTASEQARKESRKLAREILQARKHAKKEESHSSSSDSDIDVDASANPLFAEYKQQQKIYRNKTSKYKEKGGTRENETLSILANFTAKLHSVRNDVGWDEGKDIDEEDLIDEEDDSGWMLHKLKNEDVTTLRDAKDVNRDVNEDRYDLSDPRNPLNKRRREKSKKEKKDREHRHRSERRHRDR